MESDIGLPLRQFAETTESYAKSMKDMVRECQNDIHVEFTNNSQDQERKYSVYE